MTEGPSIMTPDSEALLPCPFCGAQPGVQMNQTAGYRVISILCQCGVKGPDFVKPSSDDSNLAEAITAWNTRAQITRLATPHDRSE